MSPSITEAVLATSARAGVARKIRAMVRVRMETACHGEGKRKSLPVGGSNRVTKAALFGLLYETR